jgi:predicted nucleic acid-binding protein
MSGGKQLDHLNGLYGGFEGHRVAGDREIVAGVTTALVSLDANVLLDLYRYPDDFSNALMDALEDISDRVFVSHQAITEFWRNRTSALADRARAKADVEKRLGSCHRSVTDALEAWAKQTAIDDEDLEQARLLVGRQFEVLGKLVTDNHRDDVEVYPSPSMDPVVQRLEALLDGKVGKPLTVEAFDAAVEEGRRRHRAEKPPGYKEKAADKEHLREGVSGDYLVWVQSVAEAKFRNLDLMIVTADEKEDWYWRFRDALIGPRPELAKEFWDETERTLIILTPIEFMRRYRCSGGPVPDSALRAAERNEALEGAVEELGNTALDTWTAPAVHQLLAKLDGQAPVQAAAIRAAAHNGGVVSREEIYHLGEYSPKRMLRGFTRPVRRISRLLQETGDLGLDVSEMLRPRYDFGVQANAFEIPPEVVEILVLREAPRDS